MLVRGAAIAAMLLVSQAPRDAARPVGVLVGIFHSGTDDPLPTAGSLRTIWLAAGDAAHPDAVAPVAIPDLLVPRRDGFWRVGLLPTCLEDPRLDVDDNVMGIETAIADYLWSAPVGRRPRVKPGQESGGSRERVGPCVKRDVSCMDDWRTQVFWVWPDYVSAEFGVRSDCGAHPDWDPGYAVRHVDDLSFHVRISDAFGPEAEERAEAALAAALADRRESPAEKGCTDRASFDPRLWHIERQPGGWKAEGWSNLSRICGYGVEFPVPGDLARVSGRREDDRRRLEVLKASMPRLADVHTGPGGTWVLATTAQELLLLDVKDPAHPVARVPLGELDSLVMVEWAVGASVARWSTAARRAHDVGPVRPIVVR